MTDRQLIEAKLDRIRQYLNELDPYAKMDFKTYLAEYEHFRTAERLLQLLVDSATEVNAHLLVEQGQVAPEDYYSSFLRLSTIGALPVSFAEQIAKSAGLRNRLVHDYETIDNRVVFDSIKHALTDYREYSRHILTFLKISGGK